MLASSDASRLLEFRGSARRPQSRITLPHGTDRLGFGSKPRPIVRPNVESSEVESVGLFGPDNAGRFCAFIGSRLTQVALIGVNLAGFVFIVDRDGEVKIPGVDPAQIGIVSDQFSGRSRIVQRDSINKAISQEKLSDCRAHDDVLWVTVFSIRPEGEHRAWLEVRQEPRELVQ